MGSRQDVIDAWIEREFTGHGMALRQATDDPIPGEPLMSMDIAKALTRRAVTELGRYRDDARDRLLLTISDALVAIIDAGKVDYAGSERGSLRENLIGFQADLLRIAPQLAGRPRSLANKESE